MYPINALVFINAKKENMEEITGADYMHTERVCKDFEIKNLGEYHNLYVQSDTLFLAGVFESFRNACIEMYELKTLLVSMASILRKTE